MAIRYSTYVPTYLSLTAIENLLKLFQLGGLSSFIQLFLSEVLAILRSHVAALGIVLYGTQLKNAV